ncbi:MAG: hypothetical protein DRO11_07960 [Methanobacteriota archaeon]|nr:MAG: hypothetical protein DRO11_07960 [Euryarchaeota archaeon]
MFCITPVLASAALTGSGTEGNPYLISTGHDLINEMPNYIGRGVHFELQNNLNMRSYSDPTLENFSGIFDGQLYQIRNLNLGGPSDSHVALFKNVSMDSEIKDLLLVGANVTCNQYCAFLMDNSYNYTGVFAESNSIKITNVHVFDSEIRSYNANAYVGGLARFIWRPLIINSSVEGSTFYNMNYPGGGRHVGGIAQEAGCFNKGTIESTECKIETTKSNVTFRNYTEPIGGIVARLIGRVQYSYSLSNFYLASGADGYISGTVAACEGRCYIQRNYYVGHWSGIGDGPPKVNPFMTNPGGTYSISRNYYDYEECNLIDFDFWSGGVISHTTAEMLDQANYNWGWTTWVIDNGTSYPYLPWESKVSYDPCTPDWSCVGYSECNPDKTCNSVNDLDSCGEDYTGNYSEFPSITCGAFNPFPPDEGPPIFIIVPEEVTFSFESLRELWESLLADPLDAFAILNQYLPNYWWVIFLVFLAILVLAYQDKKKPKGKNKR